VPRTLLDRLASLVVPPLCLACREPELSGAAVCPPCRARLVALPDPRCGRCGAPVSVPASRCLECRGRALAFGSAWAPFAYEASARRLVVALKARGARPAAAFMAHAIVSRAPPGLLRGTLVPVPPHPERQRREGFDQAAWLAAALGRAARLPVARPLRRTDGCAPQIGLARRERLANAPGSVRAWSASPPGPLVLVDDVYTTGATLDACAHALREVRAGSGVGEIAAVTFARAVR
jgi:predicted amidophosphoribosyltransferase